MLNCDIMTYSNVQIRAITEIEKVTSYFGEERWFTKCEITGIGYHTMQALVNKKYLMSKYVNNMSYYKLLDV